MNYLALDIKYEGKKHKHTLKIYSFFPNMANYIFGWQIMNIIL